MCAICGNPKTEDPIERWVSPDQCYNLHGTCKGCRRVTWLCRRDRRCSKYATTPKRGYVAKLTGYQPNGAGQTPAARTGDKPCQ